MKPGWDDESLRPVESGRIARYRRLQSWYREVQLGVRPGQWPTEPAGTLIGSVLDADDVKTQPDLNFLDPGAYAHALERIKAVRAEGGSLDPNRLQHNMLSSMPLCFNLFGALRNAPGFLGLFKECFDPEATNIVDVQCEWAPQPPSAFLGDRTAFDAVVFYERSDGLAFCGIETKYTEPFSPKEYDSDLYRQVTAECGWLDDPTGAPDRLKASKSNQLWRNVMLAAAVELTGIHGRGSVAVVALDGDKGAENACAALGKELSPQNEGPVRLRSVSLEQIVAAARNGVGGLPGWAERFNRRYLDHGAPGRGERRDDSGPRFGRPLTAP